MKSAPPTLVMLQVTLTVWPDTLKVSVRVRPFESGNALVGRVAPRDPLDGFIEPTRPAGGDLRFGLLWCNRRGKDGDAEAENEGVHQ